MCVDVVVYHVLMPHQNVMQLIDWDGWLKVWTQVAKHYPLSFQVHHSLCVQTVTFFFQQSLLFVSLLCVGHISKGSLELDSAGIYAFLCALFIADCYAPSPPFCMYVPHIISTCNIGKSSLNHSGAVHLCC